MKILVSDSLEQSCIDILSAEGYLVDNKPGISVDELKKIIPEYDGLVVRSATKVTEEIISLATTLKVIGRAGTGVDNIDVEAATRRGILVMNTPGGNTVSTAEHTVSMMLALARNIPQAHMTLVQGKWDRKKFTGTEVFEKTIGVIGLGKIGREVAQRCQGLGMRVIGFDPVLSADVANKSNIEFVSLEELYRRSDFITVHTPLTAETKALLNKETMAMCKRGVRLINCARGGIIEERALLEALTTGHVAGVALDVFEVEPPKDNPLLSHAGVVATPHLGASTEEAQEKVAIQIAHQIVDALKSRGYSGVVNSAAIQMTLRDEVKPFVALAEKMGSFIAQTIAGKLTALTISGYGETVSSSLPLLKASVIKGVLSHVMSEPVNIINAPFLAEEIGLTVGESHTTEKEDFSNVLRISYSGSGAPRTISGTVFGSSTPRFVQLDGFRFEVRPEGDLLVYYNTDRPGMLAKVGAVLAKHGVNIAGVSLGRTAIGANALTVMNIDNEIPSSATQELRSLEGVADLRLVRLG
ncbi:MAG: phosphoglycerate dehydrogenase [Bacteroidota bacterium]